MLKRHYEYWYAAVALHKLGAVLIPVTHMLTADDIVYRLESADVRGLICAPDDAVLKKVLRAAEKSSVKPVLWTFRRGAEGFRNLSAEIENVLMEHPAVMECSVVGVPDELRGQAIKALVVP